MFQISELVSDLIENRYTYILEKYRRTIPKDLKISAIMDYINENKLYESFVEKNYSSEADYNSPIFLILNEDIKYVFFYWEFPGVEMGMMYFDKIEDGVRKKIEFYMSSFGHRAPDIIYPYGI